jgi:acyl transferase domain-containing protein
LVCCAAQGPSVSIDTACSSSLVGAHLAATSFLAAACPRALVCGVNLTLRAETTAVLAKAGMLAQARSACSARCARFAHFFATQPSAGLCAASMVPARP